MSKQKTAKPFGGYVLDFEGRTETLEQVFGKLPLSPSKMTKKIWYFIKKHDLGNKEK